MTIHHLQAFIRYVVYSKGIQRIIKNSYHIPELQFRLLWFSNLSIAEIDLTPSELFVEYGRTLKACRDAGFKFTSEEVLEWNHALEIWELPDSWKITHD